MLETPARISHTASSPGVASAALTRGRLFRPAFACLLALWLGSCSAPEVREFSEDDRDVPFVPTPMEVVREMLSLAEVGPGDVLYDLGSGDGRIPIMAVREFNAERAVGIDIDPELVRESRIHARTAGVEDRVTFIEQNIFEAEFSEVRRRHVRDYLRILYKYRWLAAALFVVTLGVTVLVTLLTPRLYTAATRLQLQREGPIQLQLEDNVVNLDGTDRNVNGASSFLSTQVAALKSRDLAERVIRTHDLATNEAFLHPTAARSGLLSVGGRLLSFLRPRGFRGGEPHDARGSGTGNTRRLPSEESRRRTDDGREQTQP